MFHSNAFEFKRQLAHIFFGVIILWGLHFHLLTVPVLGVGSLVLLTLLMMIKAGIKVPVLYPVLHFFEREDHLKNFPGRGLFFFVLGAFLTLLIFGEKIAMAALSILLVGDAVTNLAGCHLGKTKNPLNSEKTVEGTLAGILSSFMVCVLFYPALPSFVASIVAMIVEIPKISIYKIPLDDNLSIPLSAGFILYLFS